MVMELQQARERCWAVVDLDVLCENYRRARELCGGKAPLCVLKADAYGCGIVPVARALSQEGAQWFAVASASEAVTLLSALPKSNVLILGLVGENEVRQTLPFGARYTLYDNAQGAMLARIARETGLTAHVHIKVDTGLHRLGFDSAAELLPDESGATDYEGLYSHLALHDAACDKAQFAAFDAADAALREKGIHVRLRHICDSIGMVRYPERVMSMVRTGAWLYGVCPNRYPHPEECRLVVRFAARVAQVRTVKKGERIGYDDEHYLTEDKRVATLSCGYADGAPRLNNAGDVEIRGMRAPILGLVCMDQMMVDVTHIPEVCAGDEATLLGGTIGVNEYADRAHLNRNEALSRITQRAVRIYRKNGKEWIE